MARVVMIPTGHAEWLGLPGAFEQLFPGHSFDVIPNEREMAADPDRYPLKGFTSSQLREAQVETPPENALELVSRAAGAAIGDELARVEGADLVVILDDTEPDNAGQPERVVAVMRAAVVKHIAELPIKFQPVTREALRLRVSFHLAVPMIESWFFGDPNGLERAVAGARWAANINRFAPTTDPEDFLVDDPSYAAATESACPEWVRRGRKKDHRTRWLSPAIDRTRHPKAYLQWLCLDPDGRHGTKYKEREHGAAALKKLDWPTLLGRSDPSHLQYLSALVSDVSDAVGEHPVTGPFSRTLSPHTVARPRDPQRVLRNL